MRPVDLCQILQLDQIGSVTQDPVCQKMFCQIQGSVIGAIPVKAFFVKRVEDQRIGKFLTDLINSGRADSTQSPGKLLKNKRKKRRRVLWPR